jgi:SagB-type dehydrogenase family enzyme
VEYGALYARAPSTAAPAAINLESIAEFLRCSMGLSAWKRYGATRWALRVNPSSGNLHPTETYVAWNGSVYHYAPREHALEVRTLAPSDPRTVAPSHFLVGLTSIYWREAWKYGERAFRYCQHDTGHAIAALRLAAALVGWQLALLPRWSDDDVAALLGVDRAQDFEGAEREDVECLMVVSAGDPSALMDAGAAPWVDAARRATWQGRANRLSPDHVDWPIIQEVSDSTKYDRGASPLGIAGADLKRPAPHAKQSARQIILQRRSAVAFNPTAPPLPREQFLSMLARLQPDAPPWDAIGWPPHVHLALFVHRVEGLTPGIYAYLRDRAVLPEWKAAMRPEFLWEGKHANDPNDPNDLFLLVPIDCRAIARRLSCDQDIAGDGFFSLGMIARAASTLRDHGDWMYRRLFWEAGMIGQVLYLEAEAAGARSTGIGCYYDDAVHEVLGLKGDEWQSLYHFSMGEPVEDTRLTTEPGYEWESNHEGHEDHKGID